MADPLGLALVKSLVNALPWRKRLRSLRWQQAGYDSTKDDAVYARSVYEQHCAATGARGRVLEIGPGGNVATAALYVLGGASRAVCIDSVPWVRNQRCLYEEIGASQIVDGIQYLSPVSAETCDLPDASFDIIYSHATLEHVNRPDAVVANIARMLAPGGVTSHQIDLRDHRDFSRPLDFLRLSPVVWRLLSAGMLMPPNRWRLSDYRDAFERHGLTITSVTANDVVAVSGQTRRSFARQFRRKDLADLGVLSVHLVAVKP